MGGTAQFVGAWELGGPNFTFDKHARDMGDLALNSSMMPRDAIGWLSTKTGCDLATPANTLFWPLARLDHLFTGRYLVFTATYYEGEPFRMEDMLGP